MQNKARSTARNGVCLTARSTCELREFRDCCQRTWSAASRNNPRFCRTLEFRKAATSNMTDRRLFLKSLSALGAGVCLAASSRAAFAGPYKKSLSFYHTHTGESLSRVFWADGQYLPDALI